MDQASLVAMAFKMTVALGAVLLVFGGALMIVRKFSANSPSFLKKMGTRKEKPMEVLAYQSLGPGKGMYLLRCLDKKVLIGATNHNISLISNIDDETDEDAALTFGTSLNEKVNSESTQVVSSRLQSDLREISRV